MFCMGNVASAFDLLHFEKVWKNLDYKKKKNIYKLFETKNH